MSDESITDVFKEVTGLSMGSGIVMILLGVLAIFWPYKAGIAVSIVLGWIIVVAGLAYVAYAFAARGAGSFIWRLLLGLVYVAGGGYLALHSQLALQSLTLVVAIIFFIGGVFGIVVYFQLRSLPRSGWILFEAILSLALAYVIARPWPASSTWVVGLLVGINFVVSGFTRFMYSVQARKALKAIQ